jgi:hypothetical protein
MQEDFDLSWVVWVLIVGLFFVLAGVIGSGSGDSRPMEEQIEDSQIADEIVEGWNN